MMTVLLFLSFGWLACGLLACWMASKWDDIPASERVGVYFVGMLFGPLTLLMALIRDR